MLDVKRKGLSFISNRKRRKQGTHCASELGSPYVSWQRAQLAIEGPLEHTTCLLSSTSMSKAMVGSCQKCKRILCMNDGEACCSCWRGTAGQKIWIITLVHIYLASCTVSLLVHESDYLLVGLFAEKTPSAPTEPRPWLRRLRR